MKHFSDRLKTKYQNTHDSKMSNFFPSKKKICKISFENNILG